MSQKKQALIQPLVEELLNLVMQEGKGNQIDETGLVTPQISPQLERLLEKLKEK